MGFKRDSAAYSFNRQCRRTALRGNGGRCPSFRRNPWRRRCASFRNTLSGQSAKPFFFFIQRGFQSF